MKKRYEELERSCRTCERAELLENKDIVLCEKKGIVAPNGLCRKFIYDPLKRVPPKIAPAPKLEYVDIDKD